MSYKIPGALTPQPDESLLGLVMRNAERFRFRDPMRLFARLRMAHQRLPAISQIDPGSDLGGRTFALLGLSEEEVRRLTLWHEREDMVSVLGVPVWRELVGYRTRAVCRACLAASPHHRAIWLVDAMPVCAVHGLPLTDTCPKCRAPLRWMGRGVYRCGSQACGFDLRQAAEPVDPAEVPQGIAVMHRLLTEGRRPSDRHIDLPPGEVLRMAFLLGRVALGLERGGKPSAFVERYRDRLPEVLTAGWQALDDWPRGFHAMLDRLRPQAAKRKGRFGLRKEFGALPYVLGRLLNEPAGRMVSDEFTAYLASCADLATTAKALGRFASHDAFRDRHMTIFEASRFMGVSAETMVKIAEREDLFLVRPSGAGAPSLVRADLVRALRERRDSSIFKQDAEKFLAVGRDTFRNLEQAGLIRAVPADDRVVQQSRYRKADLEGLIEALETKVREAGPKADVRLALPISRCAYGRATTVADLCRAVLDGRLRPAGLDESARGLLRIIVDAADIQDLLDRPSTTLSIMEAAERLDVEVQAVRAWVRLGLLRATPGEDRTERGLRVTEEDLKAFRADYVTAPEIAREAKVGNGRWAAERLMYLGIKPAAAPHEGGAKRYLFRRTDITEAVLARLQPTAMPGVRQLAAQEAFDLSDRVGQAAAAELGLPLRRAWHGFADEAGTTYVQVINGRRPRFKASYVFRFNAPMRKRLEAVQHGWLALAFAEQEFFLLIPWEVASTLVGRPEGDRHHLRVPVDGQGRVGALGKFVRYL